MGPPAHDASGETTIIVVRAWREPGHPDEPFRAVLTVDRGHGSADERRAVSTLDALCDTLRLVLTEIADPEQSEG